MLSIGTVLNERYRIDRMLEIGALEGQYAAWDLESNSAVVIKELEPQPDLDAEMLKTLQQGFMAQAEALTRLDHPGIARVLDYFCQANPDREAFVPPSRPRTTRRTSPEAYAPAPPINAYLVLQTVPGQTLAEVIERERTIPEQRVLKWLHQILDTLIYCHERGVVHQDINPDHIMITPDDRALLKDFEIVALWNRNDPRTWTAQRVLGTPEYAPPERWSLKTAQVDERSDIYSLGATLYHALTGERPLTAGERTSNPYRFLQVKALAPRVNTVLGTVVFKAMELPRDKRYQSAAEMAAALQAPQSRRGMQTPPPAPLLPQPKERTWMRGVAVFLIGMILFLGGLLGLYFNQTWLPLRAQTTPETTATPRGASAGAPTDVHPEAVAAGPEDAVPEDAVARTSTSTPVVAGAELSATTVVSEAGGELDIPPSSSNAISPPEGWQRIVADAFEDNANAWIESEHSDDWGSVTREVTGGSYRWEIDARQAVSRWCTPELADDRGVVSDFRVSVAAQRLSGPENAAYGLILRHTEGSYYIFNVRDDGFVQFMLWYGFAWQPILDWTETTAVRSGEVNQLTVVAEGSTFEFYVNDTLVGQAEDDQITAGEAGLSISTAATEGPARFVFDNFELWVP